MIEAEVVSRVGAVVVVVVVAAFEVKAVVGMVE